MSKLIFLPIFSHSQVTEIVMRRLASIVLSVAVLAPVALVFSLALSQPARAAANYGATDWSTSARPGGDSPTQP